MSDERDYDLRCSCRGNPSLGLKHVGQGLMLLCLRIVILSLVMAYVMAAFWTLSKMGLEPPLWPFTTFGQFQARLVADAPLNPVLQIFNNVASMINTALPGGGRFGSTMGTLVASFWTLHTALPRCVPQRFVLGLIAGAIIGFRLVFLVSSLPLSLALATLVGSVFFTTYMLVSKNWLEISTIPLVKKNQLHHSESAVCNVFTEPSK